MCGLVGSAFCVRMRKICLIFSINDIPIPEKQGLIFVTDSFAFRQMRCWERYRRAQSHSSLHDIGAPVYLYMVKETTPLLPSRSTALLERVCYSIVWIVLLLFFAWPLACFCDPWWMLFLPFEALFPTIREINSFLETLVSKQGNTALFVWNMFSTRVFFFRIHILDS